MTEHAHINWGVLQCTPVYKGNSRAAPPLVHSPKQQAGAGGKQGQECELVFQGPNYKGEHAESSSRPPDEEEDRPNQALSVITLHRHLAQ